ncbi:lysophospholipid acyltransferase family protein [Massilia sp. BJB1822]|uniref:lysophospholipid acyltransferase family protein n=1 Tax=Massilia sp. BJB1822 TaxID=2744470 RepID=UPI0015948BC9|nr:lysophospholipid acyltransferase family protein [Massilia sp. BJB1822]NVE00398.1 lysophospholipid acyltransferase family protein [Massilia sp. BJB1822]
MQHTGSELIFLARQRLHQATPQFTYRKGGATQRFFSQSIRRLFPHMPATDCHELCRRHYLSMHQRQQLRRHLGRLDASGMERFLHRHVRVEGQEYLDLARNSERPVVLFTPHYGNFTIVALKLIQAIGRIKTVNSFHNPLPASHPMGDVEGLFGRLGYGYNPISNDDSGAALKAIRALRRGEVLTIMPDSLGVTGHTSYVPFFGHLVPAMAGASLFALKSNAVVIGIYGCPEEGLQTTLRLSAPLEIERSGDLDIDMRTLASAMFRDMERQIRRSPEHWYMLPDIGRALAETLRLAPPADLGWLGQLRQAAPQFQQAIPELERTLAELAQRQMAGGGGLF